MFYRFHILAACSQMPPPDKLRDIRDWILHHWETINPGMPNEEKSYLILEECHHDENPAMPCNVLIEDHSE